MRLAALTLLALLLLGCVALRSFDEIQSAIDALTPESVGAYATTQGTHDLTILTLGPNALQMPAEG